MHSCLLLGLMRRHTNQPNMDIVVSFITHTSFIAKSFVKVNLIVFWLLKALMASVSTLPLVYVFGLSYLLCLSEVSISGQYSLFIYTGKKKWSTFQFHYFCSTMSTQPRMFLFSYQNIKKKCICLVHIYLSFSR